MTPTPRPLDPHHLRRSIWRDAEHLVRNSFERTRDIFPNLANFSANEPGLPRLTPATGAPAVAFCRGSAAAVSEAAKYSSAGHSGHSFPAVASIEIGPSSEVPGTTPGRAEATACGPPRW